MTKFPAKEHVENILRAVVQAYEAQDNPGYSDLDNEQPISLNICITLGDVRRVRFFVPKGSAQ